jgi:hypothetical protein
MERVSTAGYIRSFLAGLCAMALVAALAYVGGYFLLPDEQGLFPSQAVFKLYEPAARAQRWASGKLVNGGYVDENGRRFAKRLP